MITCRAVEKQPCIVFRHIKLLYHSVSRLFRFGPAGSIHGKDTGPS